MMLILLGLCDWKGIGIGMNGHSMDDQCGTFQNMECVLHCDEGIGSLPAANYPLCCLEDGCCGLDVGSNVVFAFLFRFR